MLSFIDPFTKEILLFIHLIVLMFALVYYSGVAFAYFLNEVFDLKYKRVYKKKYDDD